MLAEIEWTSMEVIHAPSAKSEEIGRLACLIRESGYAKNLSCGKLLHCQIIRSKHGKDRFLGNLVLQMYGKCGALWDSCSVFDTLHHRNLFSWNIMIGIFVHLHQIRHAFYLFQAMQEDGIAPDKFSFSTVLSLCTSSASLYQGKLIHAKILHSDLMNYVVLVTALIHMYGECKCLEEAEMIFRVMPSRNVVSWNVMIMAYLYSNLGAVAIEFFHKMLLEDINPDNVTYLNVLSACSSFPSLSKGKLVHCLILTTYFTIDVTLGTAIVNMYGRLGCLVNAERAFNQIPKQNIISWTTLISSYIEMGQGEKALCSFQQMQTQGISLDKIMFISLIDACALLSSLPQGKMIHAHVTRLNSEFRSDIILASVLVNMYSKCGCLEQSLQVFRSICGQDVILWNAIITACSESAEVKTAFHLFQNMHLEGMMPDKVTCIIMLNIFTSHALAAEKKLLHASIVCHGFQSDVVLGTGLTNMYGKAGDFFEAKASFDNIDSKDVMSWNIMISACAGNGHKAFEVFQYMHSGSIATDKMTLVACLDLCSGTAAHARTKCLHSFIMCRLESELILETALINAYHRCGNLKDARRVFDYMPEQSGVSCCAMINAYAHNNYSKEVLMLYKDMSLLSIMPNGLTIGRVIDACSSLAALIPGKQVHALIINSDFQNDPVVKNALVNMYGKCGIVEEAETLFDRIRQCNVVSWTTMITVYAQNGYGQNATKLFQQMQIEGLVPDDVTITSMLYAMNCAEMEASTCHYFVCAASDHGTLLAVEHYGCIVDYFGRLGQVDAAEDLICNMPFQPTTTAWVTLLTL